MKLWHKIFLCFVSLFFLGFAIFAPSIITKNFRENLEREKERCVNVLNMQAARIEDRRGIGEEESVLGVLEAGEEHRKGGKGGYLYFEGLNCLYNGTALQEKEAFQAVKEEGEAVLLKMSEGRHCILARRNLGGNRVLMYFRDVEGIYEGQRSNLREILTWGLLMLVSISLLAYWMARWVTKPLERLEANVEKLNQGENGEPVKEGKDELGKLGAAYNSMAKAVLEREEELWMAATERQRFIEAMSHELNTPLTSIQGYAQLLQNANCTQEQQMMALQNIQTETRRMQEMQKKLMEIHSIRKENLVLERVDMKSVVAGVEEELKELLDEKNITVIEQVEQKVMVGDRTLLHILLSNFLRNSITYSEANNKVEISVYQRENRKQCLQVKDHGCGIAEDQIQKVTKAFYRVDKSRSRATGGAGIGLYLCSHIVEIMHGELQIHSKIGQGTTITVIF